MLTRRRFGCVGSRPQRPRSPAAHPATPAHNPYSCVDAARIHGRPAVGSPAHTVTGRILPDKVCDSSPRTPPTCTSGQTGAAQESGTSTHIMDISDTSTNLRAGHNALATPESVAAQPKRDAIDDKPGSKPGFIVESSPRAEALSPRLTTPTDGHVLPTTAATIALPHGRRWPTATRVIAQAVRRIRASLSADSRPKPFYRPSRCAYLEDARMGREMDRL
jgi:hypothetical protein